MSLTKTKMTFFITEGNCSLDNMERLANYKNKQYIYIYMRNKVLLHFIQYEDIFEHLNTSIIKI